MTRSVVKGEGAVLTKPQRLFWKRNSVATSRQSAPYSIVGSTVRIGDTGERHASVRFRQARTADRTRTPCSRVERAMTIFCGAKRPLIRARSASDGSNGFPSLALRPEYGHTRTNGDGTPALQRPPLHVMLPACYPTAPDQAPSLARV